jgi:hypothetical protein
MKLRVVQWSVGNVGRRSIIAIHANPHLELVGCYVRGADKAGQDAGVLAGIGPIGIVAGSDVEALLALKPDCVSYNGLWASPEDFCRILERGVNIVTTSAFVTGHSLGAEARERIQAACRRGNSSIFGSGIHPGFSSLISLVATGICDRIENVSLLESVDATGYASKETWESCGFGSPIGTPGLEEVLRKGSAVFADGIHLAGEVLKMTLRRDRLPRGVLRRRGGLRLRLHADRQGLRGRRERRLARHRERSSSVVELRYRWKMGNRVEPDYPLHQGYVVNVRGRPNVEFTLKHSMPARRGRAQRRRKACR